MVIYNLNFDNKFFEYYNDKYGIRVNPDNCYELITILEKEYGYNYLKTKSLTKIMKIIDKDYYEHLDKDEFYYLKMISHLLQDVYGMK